HLLSFPSSPLITPLVFEHLGSDVEPTASKWPVAVIPRRFLYPIPVCRIDADRFLTAERIATVQLVHELSRWIFQLQASSRASRIICGERLWLNRAISTREAPNLHGMVHSATF